MSVPRSTTRPYKPSWIDRFNDWVDRLPGPSWPYYLGLAGLAFLSGQIVFWAEGTLAERSFYPLHVSLSVTLGYLPALLAYLDGRASAALAKMRPILETKEGEYDEVHYRLTTLPAWPALLAGGIVFALPLLIEEIRRAGGEPTVFSELGVSSVSYWFVHVLYRLTWWLFGTFIYHLWHQLRQINWVYTRHTRVNLYRVGPLYAFSQVTALTAVGLVIPPYVFVALTGAWLDPVVIAFILPITVLALGAFVWPLLGIHRLLLAGKARLVDENTQRFEAATAELHQRVRGGSFEGMSELEAALAALESEQRLLGAMPTWPWQSETVRLLFTALGVPLGLWIAQYLLQRVLGP
jgi:uncharacterized membrane protein YvlD (DUF360 family)